ncbi:hypothetical protein OC846_000457 [Tilletia horrida]|uniref:ENTH domain-containing protein n=1 Tax=Tilletia horrida TaxID=155126 RepID=A0AAN6GVW7_9BASI|nr:hypothetical protein OC846_000457 [Tilletia horrida]KAK0569573.1 hypothetical protein OC861_000842 [Tilletia horrida]
MSNYDKVVKSATKPKIAAPKPKYVDVLITASFSEDASLNEIIRSLANRLREPNTIIVFKSLVVLHTLVRHGAVDPVLSHLVSNGQQLRLKHIASIDSSSGYTPPRSLSVYAQYLDTRVKAYRELRRDVVRAADPRVAGSTSGSGTGASLAGGQRLRRLKVEKGLLREVNVTQKVMVAVLACSFFLDDPNDEITLAAFRMALKDLLDLYASVNEGIINVLEHYFEMSKVDATSALKLYRDFCAQTEKVVAYLTAARKYSHALRVAIPQLKHAPISLAGALEEYLNDPNFEQNRVEYRKNRQVADGESSSAPAKSTEAKSKDEPKKETEAKPEVAASKAPIPSNNQALQDFFASIDTDQHTMAFPGMASPQNPMFTGMDAFGQHGQLGMQPTGMMMMASPNGNMLGPQMTGFNPFLQPNMTGMPFGQAPVQQNAFLQAQITGMNAFGGGAMGGPQMLQAQATGVNPFRPQSVFMPTNAAGAGLAADLTGFGMMSPGGSSGLGAGGSLNRLQSISESGPSTPTVTSPPAAQPSASSNAATSQPSTSTTTASSSLSAVSSPKPLMPQKTGSRNPFAPPPGSTPPPPPVNPLKPAGPSLFELAAGAAQPAQQANGTAADSAPKLVPQKTGLIGNIASEFAFGNTANRATSPAAPSDVSSNTTQTETGTGANSLSTGFSNLSVGGGSAGSTAFSTSSLAPQPTGFGGSAIKPFQPTSSFGQTLSAQVTGIPSTSSTSFLGGAQGSTTGALAPNMTGNPFARSMSPGAGANGVATSGAAAAGGSFGSSLFGSNGPSTSTAGSATVSNGVNGSALGPTPFSLNSASGLGSQFTSLGGAGLSPGAATNSAASPSFGSSLFRSGTITANNSTGATNGANPFPLAAQPTGAFLSSFTSGLNSVGGGSSQPASLQAQPTGLGGSSIKPFQPTSAFGTAAFGGLTAEQQQKQQQQQSTSLF